MNYGRVIVIQGPSSAGKSTLAIALQKGLDEHWWALEADDITRMQATSERTGWWTPTTDEKSHPSWAPESRLTQWLAGYFGCIAILAKTGSNVIAVGGWLETQWLHDLADALQGIEAFCVGVTSPIEELERRESARGDRSIGYARSHYKKTFQHAPFDALVDTSTMTTDACIATVREMLENSPEPLFFARVRAR